MPLTYLYDPDLPLFPIHYFHRLRPSLGSEERAGATDRVFGFIHHINFENDRLRVVLVLNKDLSEAVNHEYVSVVTEEVRHRLGLTDPVVLEDIDNSLIGQLQSSNGFLRELWYRIVQPAYGNQLPFGPVWDPVFGIPRWVASWNSSGGRKGELIQFHSWVKRFGEPIAVGGGIHADFYLLPTFEEFQDTTNPLNHFPSFSKYVRAAESFVGRYCSSVSLGDHTFSKYHYTHGGSLDTSVAAGSFLILLLREHLAGTRLEIHRPASCP